MTLLRIPVLTEAWVSQPVFLHWLIHMLKCLSVTCSGTGWISKAYLDNHDFQSKNLDFKELARSHLTCIESSIVRGFLCIPLKEIRKFLCRCRDFFWLFIFCILNTESLVGQVYIQWKIRLDIHKQFMQKALFRVL